MAHTKQKLGIFLLGMAFVMNIFGISSVKAQTLMEARGMDTIAGFSTPLESSISAQKKEVTFRVVKPDGGVINVYAGTNLAGIARTEFLGYHTKQAGLYKVFAFLTGEDIPHHYNTFRVYSDSPSPTKSSLITSTHATDANGGKNVFITATIRDKYNNEIRDQVVKLLSSRTEDEITAQEIQTDEKGEMHFRVASTSPGISTFIASNTTTNTVLKERVEVVFYEPFEENTAHGGTELLLAEMVPASLLAQNDPDDLESLFSSELFGEIASFDIDIPNQGILNREISITVTAKDTQEKTVRDYLGKVSFAVPSDEDAILPQDYTFQPEDQGTKTFNLAIKFTRTGRHILEIFDKKNWDINGKKEIEIVTETTRPPSDGLDTITIQSPITGLQTGQTVITISGKGPPNIGLSIFDNDTKIGETDTDNNGFFTFQSKNLMEGAHTFFAVESNGQGRISDKITITVDVSGPSLLSFELIPDGPVETGDNYTVRITSEPNLEKAAIIVNHVKEDLVQSSFQPGTYEGTFVAPSAAGTYDIRIVLTDLYENKIDSDPHHPLEVIAKKPDLPPQVTGLRAKAGNKKVTLSWDAITDHIRPIASYKIYMGASENQLDKTVATPDPSTQYIIDNLENGQTYYFQLAAIDTAKNESESKSLIAEAIPELAKAQLRASPSDGQITLNWNAFEGINVGKHIIYYGLQSKKYSESINTPDARTTYVVPDLINGMAYYFAIVPLTGAGTERRDLISEEASAKPIRLGGFLPAAPPEARVYPTVPVRAQTGPEGAIMIILLSLLFGATVVTITKRHKLPH